MADIAIRRGLYFEEFNVGDSITSAGRTITEADIVSFAALSGDWTAIHTDAEFAKNGMFGERVAHGLLGLSIAIGAGGASGLHRGDGRSPSGLEWKFSGAIKIGDTIHVRAEVVEKKGHAAAGRRPRDLERGGPQPARRDHAAGHVDDAGEVEPAAWSRGRAWRSRCAQPIILGRRLRA